MYEAKILKSLTADSACLITRMLKTANDCLFTICTAARPPDAPSIVNVMAVPESPAELFTFDYFFWHHLIGWGWKEAREGGGGGTTKRASHFWFNMFTTF